MGIAKTGDAVRLHRRNQRTSLANRVGGLKRQAIHQIEIQFFDTGRPQSLDGRLDDNQRLEAADRGLDQWIYVLYTQAGTGDAELHQGAHERHGYVTRVEFNRVLQGILKPELTAERGDDGSQAIRSENAGRKSNASYRRQN